MVNTTTKHADDVVVRRLYARGTWKLHSVAHFGGDETGIADMCLLKDTEGKPFIPGASIAGAVRSFLAKQRLSWTEYRKGFTAEPDELKRFFGGAEKANTVEDSDPMSALTVADAYCVPNRGTTSIRDGVRVHAKSGSATDKAKFDLEVAERGTEFVLNLECIIYEGDRNYDLTALFLAILHGFQNGNIHLGARTRRGYGRGKVASWEIRDLQMKNPKDVLAWLRDDPWSCCQSNLIPRALPSDKREYFRIEADFELRTSLLIRSSSADPNAPNEVPDMTHLHSNGKPVVPGTSFAGAFRHRAALIANILNWSKQPKDKDAVCEMFGPVHEQDQPTNQQKELWASRVWIEERLVKRVKLQWQDRVAIDRFTGGSLDGALFNEKPAYPLSLEELANKRTGPNLRLRLTLEEPDEAEIGLLLLTLRDFWHGHAALGGETSNGRGTLQGIKARFKFKNATSSSTEVWKVLDQNKRMTIEEGDAAFLECCVQKAQNYANCPAGSRRPDQEKEVSDA